MTEFSKDNVLVFKRPGVSCLPAQCGGNEDGNDMKMRIARLETRLDVELKQFATKDDITKLKGWVLCVVLAHVSIALVSLVTFLIV